VVGVHGDARSLSFFDVEMGIEKPLLRLQRFIGDPIIRL
jgi:hypothetical protein